MSQYLHFYGNFYFRAVYDDNELDKFVELLDNRIKGHDREIERMCNYHYQGFIDSVRELLQVSTDAAHLRVSRNNLQNKEILIIIKNYWIRSEKEIKET